MANLPPPSTGYPRPTHPPELAVGIPEVLLPVPPYTMLLVMNACGLTRTNEDQKFATEVFMYNFECCKDISNEDRADIFKTFSGPTATKRYVRIMLAQKNNIKEFKQWVHDQFRLVVDPTTLLSPQDETAELFRQSKTHQLFVSKSDTIYKVAKTVRLKKQVKWEDW